jgi:hypothetical protein
MVGVRIFVAALASAAVLSGPVAQGTAPVASTSPLTSVSASALPLPMPPVPPIPSVPSLPGLGGPPLPDHDPFYAPPDRLGSYRPGALLRSRPVTVLGLTNLASIRAYQLLYRTTDATGHPTATVTTLMLPTLPAPGRRKLVSYHTAEDSLTTRCAPSYTLRTGTGSTQNVESGLITPLLAHGWDVVVPDYQGPRSLWAVGAMAGHAALDSVRAAEQFGPAGLDGHRTPVGMMGYSGGSIPTVWANSMAKDYAPELNLVGVAAGGIPADLKQSLPTIDGSLFFGAIAVTVAFNRAYPELELGTLLTERGRDFAEQAGRDGYGCAGAISAAPFGRLSQYTHYRDTKALLDVPRVRRTLDRVSLLGRAPQRAPAYFYNAIHDELIVISEVDDLVTENCADGASIDYHRDPLGGHLTGAAAYAGPAINFLADRFAGRRAPNTCPDRR